MKTNTRIITKTVLAALACLAATPMANGDTLGKDAFDYGDGPIAGQDGGDFWDWNRVTPIRTGMRSDWDDVSPGAAVSGGKLETADNGSAKREYNGPEEGQVLDNDEWDGAIRGVGVVYFKAVMTRSAGATWGGISSYDFGDERIFFGFVETSQDNYEFGISISNNPVFEPSGIAPAADTAYTIVGKLDFDGDLLSLWIDPNFSLSESANPPAVTRAYTGVHWSTAVRLGSGGTGTTTWDNLVVATEWNELTPGAAESVPFSLDTRNLTDSPGGGAVHTDETAYLPDDTVPGSLRQAIANATAGETVDFDGGLDGGTVTLGGNQLTVGKDLTISGSALAAGLTVSGNDASRVFAIVNNSTVTIDSLTVTGGKVGAGVLGGGGIGVDGGSELNLNDSVVTGNESGDFGGGIANYGTLNITDSTFTGNDAANFGGGIFTRSNTVLIENSTVTGNTAGTSDGAGIWSQSAGGDLTLRNVTVAGNTITGNFTGAGVASGLGAVLTLENTIIADNRTGPGTPSDLFGDVTALGQNLVENHSGNVLTGPAVNTTDPMLGPLAGNGGTTQTMALLPGSPAIDAGAATANTTATDQRGVTRSLDGDSDATATVDLGAFEALPGFVPSIPGGTIRPAADSQELTWNDLGAPMYRFYLGTDETDVGNAVPGDPEEKITTAATSHDPGPQASGGTFFWRVDAIFPGDTVVKGAVQSFGTITPQPDTRIGTKVSPTTHKRDNLYTTSGAGQIVKVKLKGRRTGKVYASFQNDGDNVDAVRLSRIKANKTLKLKSFLLTGVRQNITAALKTGTFKTADLAPGEVVVIQTQAKAKGDKARQTLVYRGASVIDSEIVDMAKGKLKTVKK